MAAAVVVCVLVGVGGGVHLKLDVQDQGCGNNLNIDRQGGGIQLASLSQASSTQTVSQMLYFPRSLASKQFFGYKLELTG